MAYVHQDFEVEVEVEYTPPPQAAIEICIDGEFVLTDPVQGDFRLISPVVGETASSGVSGQFDLSQNLAGEVTECDG